MADRVHPDDLAVLGQLHRPGDDRDLDRLPGPAPAGAIRRAGELTTPPASASRVTVSPAVASRARR